MESPKQKKITIFIVLNFCGMFLVWIFSCFGVSVFSLIAVGVSWPFLTATNFIDTQMKYLWHGFAVDREQIRVLEVERNHLALQVSLLNEELQKLLKTNNLVAMPSLWKCLPVSLVIKDEWFCKARLTLNVGREDGVQVGNVLFENGVVIGKIIECFDHVSHAVIIQDSQCRLSVKIKGSDLIGIINGSVDKENANILQVRYLPFSENYKPGQEIVTSGKSPFVPPNLLIGKLIENKEKKIVTSTDRLYYFGLVEPFFNRKIQQNIFVIIKKNK